jgi:hypothetical protein
MVDFLKGSGAAGFKAIQIVREQESGHHRGGSGRHEADMDERSAVVKEQEQLRLG